VTVRFRRSGRSAGLGIEFDAYWLSPQEMEQRVTDAGFATVFWAGRPAAEAGGFPRRDTCWPGERDAGGGVDAGGRRVGRGRRATGERAWAHPVHRGSTRSGWSPRAATTCCAGSVASRADGDEVPVRAIAPGGTAVVAQVRLDAPGLVIVEDATTPDGELLLRLQNVFVPASRVLPAS